MERLSAHSVPVTRERRRSTISFPMVCHVDFTDLAAETEVSLGDLPLLSSRSLNSRNYDDSDDHSLPPIIGRSRARSRSIGAPPERIIDRKKDAKALEWLGYDPSRKKAMKILGIDEEQMQKIEHKMGFVQSRERKNST